MSTRNDDGCSADEAAAPLNQEPGTAAPRDNAAPDPGQGRERANEEIGNQGPDEMPGYGQGA